MQQEEMLAYLETFLTKARIEKFEAILSRRTNHFTVAVEDVYQAHNTSAVIRSCEVFGIQEAHLIEAKFGDTLDTKIAMGAQKWVDVYRYDHTKACIDKLRNTGYQIIATTPHNDSCYLYDFDITPKSAFFFGTEKDGVSETVMNAADGFLKIPMEGFTESLNISVSAAIILQAVTSRLRNSNINWRLDECEIFEKKLDWTKKSIKNVDKILSRKMDIE
ncbi:TrmH family RNA methyltransferase [Ascidiimonas sp. W6]|uniref:TrmH family RNA methyltransferase n=1 Tax=Ascidiimonas meishanensis TaxID=3128903 RepID=UPI0030ED02AD